jgi:hypothetical protein
MIAKAPEFMFLSIRSAWGFIAQIGTEVCTTASLVFNSGNLGTLWQFW